MAVVHIPALLQAFSGGADIVMIEMEPGESCSVRELIAKVEHHFPGMESQLLPGDKLLPGIAVFIDGEHCLLGLRGKVEKGSDVHFIPPVAGG